METIMEKPFFLLKRRIDGIVEYNGIYYGYQEQIPLFPAKFAIFVVMLDDHSIIVARRRAIKTYKEIIGIVVLKIEAVPASKAGDFQ